uniref:BTB domain-containing protein n=1 Tax=Strongyloides stercoralis TaxID=6248 RepID=A0A0K0EAJ7_STRER
MSNNIINIRSDDQGKIHIVSSAHCDEFRNYITASSKKKQEALKSNDIIIECKGKKYILNYNVGIKNSKLLKTWSSKMNNSGFTVDMNDCKNEAVEDALKLLHTGTITISDVKILDVYKVLVKLGCHTQEEDFYDYINKCIIGKGKDVSISNENEELNFNHTTLNNPPLCTQLLQKLINDVTNIQKNVNALVATKRADSICEKKTINDLPDIDINNGVLNTKLIVGKRVYDYRDLEEIRKLPDVFKTKKDNVALGKKNFTKREIRDLKKLPDITDYDDAKIVVGKKIYDICDKEDFKKLPNYFEKIKESHSKSDRHTDSLSNYRTSNSSQRSTSVDSNTSRNSYGLKKMQVDQGYSRDTNNKPYSYGNYVPQNNIVTPPGQGNYITTEIKPSNNHFSIGDSTAMENYKMSSNFNTKSMKQKNTQKQSFPMSNKKISEPNDIVFVPPIDFFKNHYSGPNYDH